MSKKFIVLVLMVSIILMCGCDAEPLTKNTLKVPNNNAVELKEAWTAKLDSQLRCVDFTDDSLYFATKESTLYVLNRKSGNIEKCFKGHEKYEPGSISVNDELAVLNYSYYLKTLDLNSGKEIQRYVASKFPAVIIGNKHFLYKDTVIFEHIMDDSIYGMDCRTGKIIWQIKGDSGRYTSLSLYKFRDDYYYRKNSDALFCQFDPETGNVITKYELEKNREVKNASQFGNVYTPKSDVNDKEFELWLINLNYNTFTMIENGDSYSYYKKTFYYHDQNGTLKWKINLPYEIYMGRNYKDYVILDCTDKVLILDLKSKKIIWKKEYAENQTIGFYFDVDFLYISEIDGTLHAYDLSPLSL